MKRSVEKRPTGEQVRELLLKALRSGLRARQTGVLLSAGVDSTALLLGLLRLGAKPLAFTFRMDGRRPGDWLGARRTCRTYGVEHVDVVLPGDVGSLRADLRRIADLGLNRKADVECAWPVMRAVDAAAARGVDFLATGAAADGHFGLSKKAMIHARSTVEDLDAFRAGLFSRPDYAQVATMTRYAETRGVTLVAPYRSEQMQALFRGRSWEDLNKPVQKRPIREAFPAIFNLKLANHVNLQLGDSGIAEHFLKLLAEPDLNIGRWKNPVGIYRAIAAGRIIP